MQVLQERHELEQYFFDEPTRVRLASLLRLEPRPVLLGAPTLARELALGGRQVWLLEVDERFADLPGYRAWNIRRPSHLDLEPSMIFCDPPFFTVPLSDLFRAVRLLARFDPGVRIAVTYLARRARAFETVFAPLGLRRTGYRPGYLTVMPTLRNDIRVFANFDGPLWTREDGA